MGNILTGLELARKLGADESGQPLPPCYGLCFPLLTTSDGVKMGKSASGAMWLAPGGALPMMLCSLQCSSTFQAYASYACACTASRLESVVQR